MTPTNSSAPVEASATGLLKVLLIGYGPMGMGLLQGLLQSPHCQIVGVFPWSCRTGYGYYQYDGEKDFADWVKQMQFPVVSCAGVNSYEFMDVLQKLQPDILLIGSWGEIIKPHLLVLPGLTVINCHPSLLPAHRGANPFSSAIRMGDTQGGVTFHLVDEKIDEGAILLQEAIPIEADDTGGDLRNKSSELAEGLVVQLMEQLASQHPPEPIVQDPDKASYYKPLSLHDASIHWEQSPQQIYNQYRGLKPWMEVYSWLGGRWLFSFNTLEWITPEQPVRVPAGTILQQAHGQLWVATSDPNSVFCLSGFKFYSYLFRKVMPGWFSYLMASILCTPGKAFIASS